MGCTLSRQGAASPTDPAELNVLPHQQTRVADTRVPNHPLRQPRPWVSHDSNLTQSNFASRRFEFWDTRVTGDAGVWIALKATIAMINDTDNVNAIADAQVIIDAAELTLSTGWLDDGVYDRSGVKYDLPKWVVSDPANMVDDAAVAMESDHEEAEKINDVDGLDEPVAEPRTTGTTDGNDKLVELLVKLTGGNEQTTSVYVKKNCRVQDIKQEIANSAKLGPNVLIRIAYLGKEWQDTTKLCDTGYMIGHVVTAMAFDAF